MLQLGQVVEVRLVYPVNGRGLLSIYLEVEAVLDDWMIDAPPICKAFIWFWDPNPFLALISPSKDLVVLVFLFCNLAGLLSLHLISTSLAISTTCEY